RDGDKPAHDRGPAGTRRSRDPSPLRPHGSLHRDQLRRPDLEPVRGRAVRTRPALKILFFDGGGLCVFYKRLDRGTLRIPGPVDEGASMFTIGERELEDLLDGVDLELDTSRRKPTAH